MSAIEQDHSKLLAIDTFTFDLADAAFVTYFIGRTGQVITTATNWRTLATDPPDESWRITRAKLQNCWELYRHHKAEIWLDPETPQFSAKPVRSNLPPREIDQLNLF